MDDASLRAAANKRKIPARMLLSSRAYRTRPDDVRRGEAARVTMLSRRRKYWIPHKNLPCEDKTARRGKT
jgi:hypothetical protein